MFAGRISTRNPSHPVDSDLAALEMTNGKSNPARIQPTGVTAKNWHSYGPVIAGVARIHNFAFEIWGDAVTFTSQVTASGAPDRIDMSRTAFTRVKDFFSCDKREHVQTEHDTDVAMYSITDLAAGLMHRQTVSELDAFKSRYSTYFRQELKTYPHFLFDRSSSVPKDTPPDGGE